MIRAYFGQALVYYSESKGVMQSVRAMHPNYAVNAASKLLREAEFWAKEAGVTTFHPQLWMTRTALFRALADRAGE